MSVISNPLNRFHHALWMTFAMFVLTAGAFVVYVMAEKRIDEANDLRHQSLLLANELRQSSDDLTRMVRTYVVTGDVAYKSRFQEILDIREGKRPRPSRPDLIYWDLVLADNLRPRANGDQVALLDLMRRAGFSDAEFAKLALAKANSDALTRAELAAMRLIEEHTPVRDQDRLDAIAMLSDTTYHRAKAGIMRPINEFVEMVDERTKSAVSAATARATLLRILFVLFGIALTLTLWAAYRALQATLGTSLDNLEEHFSRLGKGNFATAISVPDGSNCSVLANLELTRRSLAKLDHERLRINSELARHRDQLEQLVTARTMDAEQARREAEQANKAKSLFLTNMSHEMRTPMHAIISFSRLGIDKTVNNVEPEKLRGYFTRIHQSSERLLRLLNNLLDLSKLESGTVDLQIENHALVDIAVETINELASLAAQRHISIVAQDIGAHLAVRCDRGKALQVLHNLVGNALKFSPPESQISISAHPTLIVTANGNSAVDGIAIDVSDRGIGIPDSELHSIFDEFEQGSHTRSESGGTGLGLAICRQLVQLHGGRIFARNNRDGGATFSFTLPAG